MGLTDGLTTLSNKLHQSVAQSVPNFFQVLLQMLMLSTSLVFFKSMLIHLMQH